MEWFTQNNALKSIKELFNNEYNFMHFLGILPTSLSIFNGQLVYCHKNVVNIFLLIQELLILSAIEYHVI